MKWPVSTSIFHWNNYLNVKTHFFQGINSWRINLFSICPVFRVVQAQDFILQSHQLCTGKYDWKQKFIFSHLWLDQLLTWHFKHLYLKYLVKMPSWTKYPYSLQKKPWDRCLKVWDKCKSKFTCDRWTRPIFHELQKITWLFPAQGVTQGQVKHQSAQNLTSSKSYIWHISCTTFRWNSIAAHNFFRTASQQFCYLFLFHYFF